MTRTRVACCDTHRRYTAGCVDCRQVGTARARARYRAKACGTFKPSMVDATPAREHLRALAADHNMSARQAAQIAGINHCSAQRIANGKQTVAMQSTIDAILAVGPAPIKDGRPVPVIGAARRLQALAAMGYDTAYLVDALGAWRNDIYRWRRMTKPHISARNHRAIVDLYDRIADIPGPSQVARDVAASRGWAAPAAWDDGTIDDPHAEPVNPPDPEQRTDVEEELVTRVLTERAPYSDLNEAEQVELWRRWQRYRLEYGHDGPGVSEFARRYDITASKAKTLRDRAEGSNVTPISAATCGRPEERMVA